MGNKSVAIVMGSGSDRPVMEEAEKILKEFKIPFEVKVTSAHRTPENTMEYAKTLEERGIQVVIAGAGAAAHLAGTIAAWTILPVIGVPIDSSPLKGFDALLSTVQMPGGIPVASMAIGKAGAKNAAIFAAEILSLSDPNIKKRLKKYRADMKKALLDGS